MSNQFNSDTLNLIKDLIVNITKYDVNSELTERCFKKIVKQLQKADSIISIQYDEITNNINGLCEKYAFHGFIDESEALKKNYDKYIQETNNYKINTKLSVVKFLINLSERPTKNLTKINNIVNNVSDDEELIDWVTYLKEDLPRWSPTFEEDSSDAETDNGEDDEIATNDIQSITSKVSIKDCNEIVVEDYNVARRNLLQNIQHTWFNQNYVRMQPESKWPDANVTLLWEKHLEESTYGLVNINKSSIVKEHLIINEILWQFMVMHESFMFKFSGNKLVAKEDVTIASITPLQAFQNFLTQFIDYIELYHYFKEFYLDAMDLKKQLPNTYRSYACGINEILTDIKNDLLEISTEVVKQETTLTLISLLVKFKVLFEPLKVLKNIHDVVIIDSEIHSFLECSTHLLSHLFQGLRCCYSKLEQDIYLGLYLNSFYYYFSIIEDWFDTGEIPDNTEEFVIVKVKASNGDDWGTDFIVNPNLDVSLIEADGLLKIICTDVRQIGKNLYLLRLLEKWRLIGEIIGKPKRTLRDEYNHRVLEQMNIYFGKNCQNIEETIEDEEYPPTHLKWPEFNNQSTNDLDKLENFVDTTNVFLMTAFKPIFTKKEQKNKTQQQIFQKIRCVTESLIPVRPIIENTFMMIIRERYIDSGLMVKNVLMQENKIAEHFDFLMHIFLFKNDLIAPLYERIFHEIDVGGDCGNSAWLTTLLYKNLTDFFPEIYNTAYVHIDLQIQGVPLESIKMQYKIEKPLNIAITNEQINMYATLFQFILKLKWALYVLNHLHFADLKVTRKSIYARRLQLLRFGLIKLFNNVQQYIFEYVYRKNVKNFENDLETSDDLESLVTAHDVFIKSLYEAYVKYQTETYGFKILLNLIKQLQRVWMGVCKVNINLIMVMEDTFKECRQADPLTNPKFVVL